MQHPGPSEVHEQSYVVGINYRKPTLTGEIFHDDFH